MEESTRPTIVSLASSLLADLRRLVAQALQLAKHEMQHELSKLVKAAIQAGVALVLSLMAMILLCLTLVYLLHSPPRPLAVGELWNGGTTRGGRRRRAGLCGD